MSFSAASSSSWVLTPGRILRAISSSTFVWMAPAASMASISAGDFLMITAPPSVRGAGRRLQVLLFEAQHRERGPDVAVHLVGRPRAVEAAQQSGLLVAVDQ